MSPYVLSSPFILIFLSHKYRLLLSLIEKFPLQPKSSFWCFVFPCSAYKLFILRINHCVKFLLGHFFWIHNDFMFRRNVHGMWGIMKWTTRKLTVQRTTVIVINGRKKKVLLWVFTSGKSFEAYWFIQAAYSWNIENTRTQTRKMEWEWEQTNEQNYAINKRFRCKLAFWMLITEM